MFFCQAAVAAATTATTNLDGINYTPMDPSKRPEAKPCQQLKKDLTHFLLLVPSRRGGGRHGHLALMYTDAKYQALPGAPQQFLVPQHPGTLQLPPNTGAATIANCKMQYKQELHNFNVYQETQLHGVALI